MPFGEYQPGWFPLPIQVVPGGGFAGGPGPATLHVPGLPPFGPLICYEAIFPGQVVDEADRPDWLVNVTNDAWFGNSSGPRQHLAAARMRAVEEGLPLMRAANTGITAGFDAFGHELGRLGMGRPGRWWRRCPADCRRPRSPVSASCCRSCWLPRRCSREPCRCRHGARDRVFYVSILRFHYDYSSILDDPGLWR